MIDKRDLEKLGELGWGFFGAVTIMRRSVGGEIGLEIAWRGLYGAPMPSPIASARIKDAIVAYRGDERITILYDDGRGEIRRTPWSSGPANMIEQMFAALEKKMVGGREY